MEVRRCGCDGGGSHGGVEDEARSGAWSGRSDRSGGGESFGTRPENSPEKFSGGGWPEWRWLPDFEREEGMCGENGTQALVSRMKQHPLSLSCNKSVKIPRTVFVNQDLQRQSNS
ncbi:hypothetical protein Tco_0595407 [Tanacetum coccineum]